MSFAIARWSSIFHEGYARWQIIVKSPSHGLHFPRNVWDHWYYYTHRGNMTLYRRMLREPASWTHAGLREGIDGRKPIPEGMQFSRMRARLPPILD